MALVQRPRTNTRAHARARSVAPFSDAAWRNTCTRSVVLFCNFLTTLLPFKRFGVLVITIFNMLAGDIFHFLVPRPPRERENAYPNPATPPEKE